MADVTVELGNAYIGSAYSPVVEITETAEGHTVSITSADPEAQGQLVTQSYTVPDWSDEEAGREAQEAARQAAESEREAAEDERAEAEQARAAAESGRANAEAERRGYEQARRADESARVAAEQARQAAESLRSGNESVRQSAEQSRSASEVERRQAEHERRVAEELREQAEQARQSAEEAREAAEQARQADTAAAIADAETATADAQTATTAAQAATTAADTAAQGADEAAERADTAREAIDSHLRWADGNVPVGHLPEGGMLQADDAYATLPIGATAYGASTQDGTPAPDAPVPIASVTDLSLMLTGRNLLDAGAEIAGKYINASGTESASADWNHSPFIAVAPGETYTFTPNSASGNSANGAWYASDIASSFISSFPSGPQTVTAPDDARYVRLSYKATSENVQFELGDTATAYQPYVEGTTLPIDLQGHELRSLPDGTRDELAVDALGNVTLTQRVGSVDLGTLTWARALISEDAGYRFVANGFSVAKAPANNNTRANLKCSGYDIITANQTGIAAEGMGLSSSSNLIIYDAAKKDMTAIDFKAAMNGIMLHYELVTPITIDLGTVTLPTLPSPDLTAWPMTDVPTTMALDYERDIELALTEARDEAMAAIADPDGPTATANHAVGTYLTMGGHLYKVTTAIATGEAIVPGTNVTATTVMAEVLALTQ